MKTRVLFSSHGAGRYGAERVLLAIAEDVADRFDVTLEFPHPGPAVEQARLLAGVNVTISERTRLPRNAAELARFLASFPVACSRVGEVIRAGGYDVVWVNSLYNAAAAIAARRAGKRVVWHLHESNFAAPAARAVAAVVSTLADLVVVPSGFVAESFTAAGLPPGMVRIVPNGLLTPLQQAPQRSAGAGFIVGYLGQLEPRKRVNDVVDAMTHAGDDTHAVLAGDGKARRSVERRIRSLGLERRVSLRGFVSDVAAHIASCDCMVIPSRDEPFGLVALEAMAVGRPVIAARSGALPEVLGDAALFCETGDVAALAAHVRRLRDDPALAARLIAAGVERVGEFRRERMVQGIVEILQEAGCSDAAGKVVP